MPMMNLPTGFLAFRPQRIYAAADPARWDGLEYLHPADAETILGGVGIPKHEASTAANPTTEKTPEGVGATQWSDSLQSILEQPPAALPQRMILGGIMFTAVVGIWSWFGTVEEVSFAQGQLVPKGNVYPVQASVAGEVVEVFVEEGESVDKGQILLQLDYRLATKEVERLTHSLDADRQKLAQTEALIQQTQLELTTLQAIANADIEAQEAAIAQEETAVTTNQRVLDQLQIDRQAQETRMERLLELVERGAFAEDQLFQVEQALRDRERSITETRGIVERSASATAQLEAELAQTEAMAEKNQLDAAKQLQQLQIEATELEANIQETQALLERSQTELTQTTLVAPVSGAVSSLEVSKKGVVLQPSQTIAEIAPYDAPLVLSALLPTRDAGLVKPGMEVNIKFDAFPYQDYGIVTGEVISISPDTKVEDETGAAYNVDISLDATHMEDGKEAITLNAGQTATAEIIVRQRRIISLILDPIRKLQKGNLSL
jgi:HlyD family type I secretion membrane fusion protein